MIIKILKWGMLLLWLFCLTIFIIGQLNAPVDYVEIEGNPWGNLFGTSFVIGVISFILAITLFIFDYFKNHHKKDRANKKYEYSFIRISSRLILAILIAICFGLIMFPFMTIADGMLYDQRAAIGQQNMLRIVILWGVFTALITFITLWLKRFRMTSVFLIAMWLVGVGLFAVILMFSANNYRCERAYSYQQENEINRALDLISQRTGVDSFGSDTIWQTIFNFRNCINIQYLESDSNESEGYFEYPQAKDKHATQNLKILINPSYQAYDDLTLAMLLSHELVHVGQYLNDAEGNEPLGCFEKEANAFTAQQVFFSYLNPEEQRSIIARLENDETANPQFGMILANIDKGQSAYEFCSKKYTDIDEINKCSWAELESSILGEVKQSEFYKKQCLE